MAGERLTACLIVQDEQEHLAQALASVAFCEEIVVVDGGSTDRTVAIARRAGATVIENPWPGFAAQRNLALDSASGEWVLELDADERVSPTLRASIERFLRDGGEDANIAVCPLRNRFLGGPLGRSAKYPAYRSRLFRRSAYRHDESRTVHEGIEPRERPAVLDGDIEHELAASVREALTDAWRYARLESQTLAPPRDPLAYLVGVVVRPLAKAAYRLLIDAGWRDGWRGLLKISLDAASDSLVWLLLAGGAARRRAARPGAVASASGRHFGRRPAGEPKVIALAAGERATQAARLWLGALRRAGVDTALICDIAPAAEGDAGQAVGRLGPLAAMRAVDVETQIRTAHALVAFGPRARIVRWLLPRALRPAVAGVNAHSEPAAAAERLRGAQR